MGQASWLRSVDLGPSARRPAACGSKRFACRIRAVTPGRVLMLVAAWGYPRKMLNIQLAARFAPVMRRLMHSSACRTNPDHRSGTARYRAAWEQRSPNMEAE